MSGVNYFPWDGTQVGPGIGWPFPQSLLHLYPCRQDKFVVKGFVSELILPSLHWEACLTTGCSNFNLYIPSYEEFQVGSPPKTSWILCSRSPASHRDATYWFPFSLSAVFEPSSYLILIPGSSSSHFYGKVGNLELLLCSHFEA